MLDAIVKPICSTDFGFSVVREPVVVPKLYFYLSRAS